MIHIAVASDEAYLPWTATLMRSVLDHHSPDEVVLHLLSGSIAGDELRRLDTWIEQTGGSLRIHEIEREGFEGLPSVDRFGRIVWARFLLPELLPEEPRVLCLDADTFIVGSLETLWATTLDHPLGAVANVVEPALHAYVRSLGISDPMRYFNSGVLLMDLAAMREEDTTAALARFVSGAERLRWPDQDALNVLYAERWAELHPRWNAMSSLWTWRAWAVDTYGTQRVEEAVRTPTILHFEGPSVSKPWHYLCAHPWTELYRETFRRTPWSDAPFVGRTVSTRLIALLPRRSWTTTYVRTQRLRRRLGRLAGRRWTRN